MAKKTTKLKPIPKAKSGVSYHRKPPRFLTRGKWFSVSNAIKVLFFPGYNSLLETNKHEPLVRKRGVVEILCWKQTTTNPSLGNEG